jgi:hypothetical protein
MYIWGPLWSVRYRSDSLRKLSQSFELRNFHGHITDIYKWACLLKQQTSGCRPRKKNFRFPFPACRKQTEVFHIVRIYQYIETAAYMCMLRFQIETEAKTILFNPFTVCSSCKWKSVVWPFVYKETKESYPFANRLNRLKEINGLNGLTHLWSILSSNNSCW